MKTLYLDRLILYYARQEKKIVVRKTSFEEEQQMKEEEFLKLKPAERLRIHEQLRKRIWGDQYNKLSLKGMKVTKKLCRNEFLWKGP